MHRTTKRHCAGTAFLKSVLLPAAALATGLTSRVMAEGTAVQPVSEHTQAVAERAPLLDEIIVTARRKEESVQDVPISISVFNQEQLEQRNVVNASDLALYTPSLSSDQRFGPDNSSFAIRGFT